MESVAITEVTEETFLLCVSYECGMTSETDIMIEDVCEVLLAYGYNLESCGYGLILQAAIEVYYSTIRMN